jgi:DNA mismatch repair ATPase MutS
MNLLSKILNNLNNNNNNIKTKDNHNILINNNYKTLLNILMIDDNIKHKFLIDTDFFNNIDFNNDKNIFNIINLTQTYFGKAILFNTINNYNSFNINNINNIHKTIDIINNSTNIDISYIKNIQDDLLWFYKPIDENLEKLINQLYFNFHNNDINKWLNSSSFFLNLSSIYNIYLFPLFNTIGPILSIIVPIILFKIFKINIPFNFFLKFFKYTIGDIKSPKKIFSIGIYIILYLYSIYKQFKHSYDLKQIVNQFHNKLISIKKFINTSKLIFSISPETFSNLNIDFNSLNFINYIPDKIKFIEFTGNILKYQSIFRNNDLLTNLFKLIGNYDFLLSINQLILSGNFSKTIFNNNDKPFIKCKDLYHPCLNNPTTNDIILNNNILIITGPNAAGKSTFIKSLTINIILAQTLGISSSKYFELTPFDNIITHINTPDSIGISSLFESEMYKCKDIINAISIDNSKKNFIVMDELFSSTNYREGYSATIAILNKIASFNNNITILTTHYEKLDKFFSTNKLLHKNHSNKSNNNKIKPLLKNITPNNNKEIIPNNNKQIIPNNNKTNNKNISDLLPNTNNFKFLFKMFPIHKVNDNISYTYKLTSGISKDFIALDILKNNGFDNDIVTNAMLICNNLIL